MKYLSIIVSISFISFISCYQDSFIEETTIITYDPDRIFLSQITGTVLDTSGISIADAIVSIAEMRTMTDRNGKFILFDVPIKDKSVVISVNKTGYIENATRIYNNDNLSHDVSLILIPESISISIDGATGGIINDPSGISLEIQAANFIRDGVPYLSELLIQIYWVDADHRFAYPKGLMIHEVWEENASPEVFDILKSSSMAYITVLDEQGNKLDVDPEKPIKVSFPAKDIDQWNGSNTQQSLLSYDPTIGSWKEEGSAAYNGSSFTAELSHFSWWSVGTTTDAVEYCYEFMGDEADIANALLYTISKTDGTIIKLGIITLSDTECLLLEADSQVELKVYGACFIEVYSQSIDPAQVSTTDIITLEIDDRPITIVGQIENCNGAAISDSVKIVYGTELTQDLLGTVQGIFTINLDPCFSSEFLFVKALKDGILEASAEIRIVPNTTEYAVVMALCQEMVTESNLVLDDFIISQVIARQNPQETIIIAGDGAEPDIILAFDGSEKGVFTARIIDDIANYCEGEVVITEYGDIGEFVRGTYQSNSTDAIGNYCPYNTGSFAAVREK